jgi:ankyrin repeat protein
MLMKRLFQICSGLCIPCLAIILGSTALPQDTSDDAVKNFFDAIKKGELTQVKEILKKDPALARSSNEKGTTAALYAVYVKHNDIPELVHAYSPDGWTALHLNFGHLDIVNLLLDSGADINAVSKNKLVATPLQGSVVMKNLTLGKLLLDRGAKVSPHGEGRDTPLREAAGGGEIEFAKLLLERGADVNARDDAGNTPLTIALESKQPETTTLLREHGAVQ